jgi:thiol-disulfide isomerase/thioredoxin
MAPTVSRLEEEYKGRVDFLMYDSAGLDEATRQKYRYLAVPQFVIVRSDGEIAVTRLGYQSYDTLKADIEAALAGR